jgi:hypothetical protein
VLGSADELHTAMWCPLIPPAIATDTQPLVTNSMHKLGLLHHCCLTCLNNEGLLLYSSFTAMFSHSRFSQTAAWWESRSICSGNAVSNQLMAPNIQAHRMGSQVL